MVGQPAQRARGPGRGSVHRGSSDRCRAGRGARRGLRRGGPAGAAAAAPAHPVPAADPGLVGLLYAYGRYLLIASSRPGGLPANLQSIWNDQLQAPWSANYTTNINVEMNYWPAEVANLAELAEPLFDLIDGLTVTGGATAARLYGAPGWVAHHNTDPWAYSQPVGDGWHDPRWAFWPLAGAWLVRHLWEHLLFGADDAFARRAWVPIRSPPADTPTAASWTEWSWCRSRCSDRSRVVGDTLTAIDRRPSRR